MTEAIDHLADQTGGFAGREDDAMLHAASSAKRAYLPF